MILEFLHATVVAPQRLHVVQDTLATTDDHTVSEVFIAMHEKVAKLETMPGRLTEWPSSIH